MGSTDGDGGGTERVEQFRPENMGEFRSRIRVPSERLAQTRECVVCSAYELRWWFAHDDQARCILALAPPDLVHTAL